MNRNTFLRLFAAAGAWITNVLPAQARPSSRRTQGPIAVSAGKDRYDNPIHIFDGDTFYVKIGTADTDGDLFAFESTRGKKGGPALHIHPEQDEWFYILSGEFLVRVGDQTFTAKAGDSVLAPRNVPHAFAKINEEKEEARMLITYQPAGKMESLFKAVSEGLLKNMGEAEQKTFKAEHGIVVVGPALTYLKQ
jgi:quercetin dioxygenase-like cupin family protein